MNRARLTKSAAQISLRKMAVLFQTGIRDALQESQILPASLPLQVKRKIIMVMGVQRSGTTALFKSLASDSHLTAFHESIDDALYYLYRLRPLREIAPVLEAAQGTILLKPITETLHRSLEELLAEYTDYALQFIWIYRDPVNVLASMVRKGWLPVGPESDQAVQSWIDRNRLALRFCKSYPEAIVIVRYEDLVSDPEVFRSLCKSLDVSGASVFRKDRGKGRQILTPPVQRKIDALTQPTLRELNSARTVKPGRLHQWKTAAEAIFSRNGKASASPSVQSPGYWQQKVADACPLLPSELDGLSFWLDAERLSPVNERVREAVEMGPLSLCGASDEQPPFCLPFLNGRPALFFPTSKAPQRLNGGCGLLRFVAPATTSFPFLRESFSGFALIKPHIPTESSCDQERTVALRIRAEKQSTEFVLEWDRALCASRVTFRRGDQSFSVTTDRASHPHQHWRMIHFQFEDEMDPRLLVSADGIENTIPLTNFPACPPESQGWTMEIGGSESDPAALFYGAIAEIILFARGLTQAEKFGVTSYLKQKYRL